MTTCSVMQLLLQAFQTRRWTDVIYYSLQTTVVAASVDVFSIANSLLRYCRLCCWIYFLPSSQFTPFVLLHWIVG